MDFQPPLPCHQSLLGACSQTLPTVHLNIVSTYANDISSTIKLKQYVFWYVISQDYAVDIFWNTARASLLLNETLTHFIAQSCAAQESMTGRYWKLLQYSMTNYIKQNRHVHNQILHNIIKSGNETCGFEDLLDNLNARMFLAISTIFQVLMHTGSMD